MQGSTQGFEEVCSSAYELDILRDLGISLVFSVQDLNRYHTSMGPQLLTVRPLQPPLL